MKRKIYCDEEQASDGQLLNTGIDWAVLSDEEAAQEYVRLTTDEDGCRCDVPDTETFLARMYEP